MRAFVVVQDSPFFVIFTSTCDEASGVGNAVLLNIDGFWLDDTTLGGDSITTFGLE